MRKEEFLCTVPFGYSEVFKDRHYLCCPGWLPESVYETGNMKTDFHSKKSNSIRESIIDGSYKYCSSTQCPHLSNIKQGKQIDGRFIPKTENNIQRLRDNTSFNNINLCFDESCNYKCPSCRLDFINFKGKEIETVEEKLLQVENELAPTLTKMTLTGGGDPFFSNSFRKFLLRFEPSKFPLLQNIHILTNGSLWTESLWKKLHKIHRYVKTAEISIDAATQDTYENKTRLGGVWSKLLDNLEFITTINTVRTFTFSFVTQDTNFREMDKFVDLFENFESLKGKRYKVFFNHITNWGTFTEEEYQRKDISNPNHVNHQEFLTMLNKIKDRKNVVHNFNHLIKFEPSLI